MVVNMTFGKKLFELRKNAGISQEQLAEKLDVTRQAISIWENDNGYPEVEKVIMISKIFDVSVDYLLNSENIGEEADNAESDNYDILENNLTSELRKIRIMSFGMLAFALIFLLIIAFGNMGILVSIPLFIIGIVLIFYAKLKSNYKEFLSSNINLSNDSISKLNDDIKTNIKYNMKFCYIGIFMLILGLGFMLFQIYLFEESLVWYFINQPDFAAVNVFMIVCGICTFITSRQKIRVYKHLADKLGLAA